MVLASGASLLQSSSTSYRIAQLSSHIARRTMSSSSKPVAAPAPWRSLFLEHVESMGTPEFTLSTIRRVPSSSSSGRYGISAGGFVHVPRARTCVFRGFWANLPVNPKNDAPLNPELFDTELLTFTTDVRMDKMPELWDDEAAGLEGTGGGGPVEMVFWAEAPMVQWRVRGRAYVLGPDVEGSAASKTRDLLRQRMRKKDSQHATGQEGEWSWTREITAHFGNLSPGMRGSFKNPPPGRPINLPVDDGLELGQKVTNLTDEIARKNFRVVVVVPEEVDRCDLSDPNRARRWIYRFVGQEAGEPEYPGGHIEDGWEKVETWP